MVNSPPLDDLRSMKDEMDGSEQSKAYHTSYEPPTSTNRWQMLSTMNIFTTLPLADVFRTLMYLTYS